MQGELVPLDHTLVRYCTKVSLSESGAPGAASFARKVTHTYLSVNDADLTVGASLRERAAASKALIQLEMNPNGLLAAIPVQSVTTIEQRVMTVSYEPSLPTLKRAANPFHCGIFNVPDEEELKLGNNSVLLSLATAVIDSWRVGSL